MEITRKLAETCSNMQYSDLPHPVTHQVKRCIIDWLGVGLAAAGHETTEILRSHVLQMGGAPQATIVGSGDRVSVEQAALVNGTMSHVHDYDDTHLTTVIHPSSPIIGAATALAEWRSISGRQWILAIAVGMEAALRIGLSVYPSHYDRGWHITGTAGVLGAAVAGCKIEGLKDDRMATAMGIAATQSSGLREFFGTMTKPYLPGHAASNGVRAALLAGAGFSSSLRALEAPRGWASVLSPCHDLEVITRDWSPSYEILNVGIKPYPSGVVTHPGIDGALDLKKKFNPDPKRIESVELQVHPLVLELTGKTEPRTGLEGKFSIYHCVASALTYGKVGLDEFTDETVRDPQVVNLRKKIRAESSSELMPEEAQVTIHMSDGTDHCLHIAHARGSVQNPITDEDLEAKFRMLVAPVLGQERAESLLSQCWDLENSGAKQILTGSIIRN